MIKHRPVCDPVRHSFSQLIYVLFVWVKIRRVLQVKHDDGITAHEVVVPRVVVGRLDAQLEHCPHRGLDHALEGWLAEMLGLRCVQGCVADIREKEGPGSVAGAFAVKDRDGVALERRELLVDLFLVVEFGIPRRLELFDYHGGRKEWAGDECLYPVPHKSRKPAGCPADGHVKEGAADVQTEDMVVTTFWVNESCRPANGVPWETDLEKSTISFKGTWITLYCIPSMGIHLCPPSCCHTRTRTGTRLVLNPMSRAFVVRKKPGSSGCAVVEVCAAQTENMYCVSGCQGL